MQIVAGEYDSLCGQDSKQRNYAAASEPPHRAASWTGGGDQASASKGPASKSQTSSTFASKEKEFPAESNWDSPAFPRADAGSTPQPELQPGLAAEHLRAFVDIELDADVPEQSSPIHKETAFSEASQQTILENNTSPAPPDTEIAVSSHADASLFGQAAFTLAGDDSSSSVALDAPISLHSGHRAQQPATNLPAASEERPARQGTPLLKLPLETRSNFFTSAFGGQSIASLGMNVLSAMGGGPQPAEGHAAEGLRESQGSTSGPKEGIVVPTFKNTASEDAKAGLTPAVIADSPRESRHSQRSGETSRVGLALLPDLEEGVSSSAKTFSRPAGPASPTSEIIEEQQSPAWHNDSTSGKLLPIT